MYSGSCSSVKSNGTLEDKAQAEDSSLDNSGREEESDNSGRDEESDNSDDSENDIDESEDDEDRVIIEATLPLDEEEQILEPKETQHCDYDNQQLDVVNGKEIESIQETRAE